MHSSRWITSVRKRNWTRPSYARGAFSQPQRCLWSQLSSLNILWLLFLFFFILFYTDFFIYSFTGVLLRVPDRNTTTLLTIIVFGSVYFDPCTVLLNSYSVLHHVYLAGTRRKTTGKSHFPWDTRIVTFCLISSWQVCCYVTRYMMYLVHWSEIEKVQRYSGVFAASSIPSSLTFGPYKGPLNILLKTNEHKHLDYILEVRKAMSPRDLYIRESLIVSMITLSDLH